ncbi:MAG: NADH-quinone oxidoreductase subunit, partial [Actinomycetota bacterium]|nr:NADH-quinone oxidoreductase subunit [Actinomycetota bacterium]
MADGAPTQVETVTITVDGTSIEARKGEMVIAAAERGGVYIPRFCWHPRLRPVGMCRMCLVEVKNPRGWGLAPACYVPVADGQEVITTSPKVKKAQDGVLEFLLINHPLDCPVCDRGGECPLQDQTFAFGPGESRMVEEKRHWEKPIPINPLVALDRERCIQCARCTRFADEVAGDTGIDFVGRSDVTEVNTFPSEPFTSNFSGNIVQICPVGALTAAPYRFKARPWDLEVVESTCTFCSVGCRIAVQSTQNDLIRHLGIDSDPVNHGWLCDKGRFGYEAIESAARLTTPLVRGADGTLTEGSWTLALQAAADGLRQIIDTSGPGAVAVIGGARLANEDAYAWARLAKSVLGTDNVDCQLGDGLPAEVVLGLPQATIDEACAAPAILLLGPDLKEELPVLYLRLREAIVDKGVPLVELVPAATGLTGEAAVTLLHRPGEAASVARALVGAIAGARVSAEGAGGVPGPANVKAAEVLGKQGVVVVLGRPSLAEPAAATVDAAGVLAQGLPGVRFLPVLRRANVRGALDMGL